MIDSLDTIVGFMLVFILGNIAARLDKSSENVHKECDKILKIYYAALLGACFRLDSEKFQDLAKQFINSSERVLKEDKK